MAEGSIVSEIISQMRLPEEEVAMMAINGRRCGPGERLEEGDRLVLVHPNAVGMWGMLDIWNKRMHSTFNFGVADGGGLTPQPDVSAEKASA
jgi:hypothetical protein